VQRQHAYSAGLRACRKPAPLRTVYCLLAHNTLGLLLAAMRRNAGHDASMARARTQQTASALYLYHPVPSHAGQESGWLPGGFTRQIAWLSVLSACWRQRVVVAWRLRCCRRRFSVRRAPVSPLKKHDNAAFAAARCLYGCAAPSASLWLALFCHLPLANSARHAQHGILHARCTIVPLCFSGLGIRQHAACGRAETAYIPGFMYLLPCLPSTTFMPCSNTYERHTPPARRWCSPLFITVPIGRDVRLCAHFACLAGDCISVAVPGTAGPYLLPGLLKILYLAGHWTTWTKRPIRPDGGRTGWGGGKNVGEEKKQTCLWAYSIAKYNKRAIFISIALRVAWHRKLSLTTCCVTNRWKLRATALRASAALQHRDGRISKR